MNAKSPALITLRKAADNASRRGFNAEAKAISLRAMDVAARFCGVDSYEFLENIENVVAACRANGDVDEAEQYQYRVLTVASKLYGDDNTVLALQLRNLAEILREGGKEFEAKKAEKMAGAILARAQTRYAKDIQSRD
jgi:hypothetical protein